MAITFFDWDELTISIEQNLHLKIFFHIKMLTINT